ncbi:hypothetical protein LUZ61_008740 [Rhynchospora tenuis]|uniref:Malectin-like domain-containing protein n=1 Tax=Rhynchospora tenuis TaxID=198213 RepID=A0AAD5ZVX1_9POAL|nr:hypothetical protein LUZ61_008740 [Rhynchospora tenuis]
MVRISVLIIFLFGFPLHILASLSPPQGYLINCGSTEEKTYNDVTWIPDGDYINVGNASTIKFPNLMPMLETLRYFPDMSARKYCYMVPVTKGANYLVRTSYYYGGFDGGDVPPVFDQIVEGTKWSLVDTRANYANDMATYYEVIVGATGRTLSVCLARNENTTSSPFISALELMRLEDSVYNATDFSMYALSTIARHRFGYEGPMVGYPDDQFNRYWEAYTDKNSVTTSKSNTTSVEFWNLPPDAVFSTGLTTSRVENLTVQWPPMPLPPADYYVALYFQDDRSPSLFNWRMFDVLINGEIFYKGLNVSTGGTMVYSASWPLSGLTTITLVPDVNSPIGPIINAAELLMVVPLGGRTHPRDVIGMMALAKEFNKTPPDWSGDPCLPAGNSWTGLTCSEDSLARVISLNLTNYGLGGSISENIANLTGIKSIWLPGNYITGTIPEMGTLRQLAFLHLENNQLTGSIPESLGTLPKIQEIFIENNNLDYTIPDNLKNKTGLVLQVSPGNS